MTLTKKRHIIRNLKIKEISSVDNPAQVGATAVLLKRADSEVSEILKNATAVAAGQAPAFSASDYENAMDVRSAELAKEMNCSREQAFAKCLTTDPTLRTLAHASEVARASAYGAGVRKRHTAA